MMFVLMMIIVVAAFSISNTLITVIVQKKREIGVLKALGAAPGKIVSIFMGQGFVVGVLGNVVGLMLGGAVLYWRNDLRAWLVHAFNVDIFSASVYSLSGIPSAITAQDIALICATSMLICLLAAYIPARFAARLDPVKALREE
jgi:lipoprotein-releasing system permease protein